MDAAEYIGGRVSEALSRVPAEARGKLIDSILESRRVLVCGSGRSGLAGQMFAVRLAQLGIDVHFGGEMTAPAIGKGDLVILVSGSGRTGSVAGLAKIARERGARVACVTADGGCGMAGDSGISIVLESGKDADSARLAPLGTLFEDSALMFFESLVPSLMERLGASEEDMRRNHADWL